MIVLAPIFHVGPGFNSRHLHHNHLSVTLETMNIFKRFLRIALIVEGLLLMGFLPTLFNPNARIYGGSGGGWDWSPWGFMGPMAGLMFLTGVGIDAAWRNIKNPVLRGVVIALLLLALASIWVGIVKSA